MAKAKQGDKFSCAECGLVVVVDEACGCAATAILCCEQPMAKGKPAVAKTGKKAVKTAVSAKAKAGAAKTTVTDKKAPVKAAAAKPKAAAPVKAAPKKAPAKKKAAAAKK